MFTTRVTTLFVLFSLVSRLSQHSLFESIPVSGIPTLRINIESSGNRIQRLRENLRAEMFQSICEHASENGRTGA